MNWFKIKSLWLLKSLLVFSNAAMLTPFSELAVFAQEEELGSWENPCRSLEEIAGLLNDIEAQSVSVSSDRTKLTLEKDLNVKEVFARDLGFYFTGQKDAEYFFDLNGHKLTTEVERFLVLKADEEFTFTIEDSKGNGSIESTASYEKGSIPYALLQTGTDEDTASAVLNLKSGTFTSNEVVAFSDNKSLLEIENATLICRTSEFSMAAVNLQLEGALHMYGGSIFNENGYGIGSTGNNDILIGGGSIQATIGINTNAPRTAKAALTMTSGTIEGEIGGINAQQLEADISGDARISGGIGIFCSGKGENRNETILHISQGSITGMEEGIYYSLQSDSYNPQTDGYVSIDGGEIIATDENAPALFVSIPNSAASESSDSSASLPSVFKVTGGSFSSKVDPAFIGEAAGTESESITQVYNSKNAPAPWQYYANFNQALQALNQAPLNTLTSQEDLFSSPVTLSLNANAPAQTGIVSGLYGTNEYVMDLNAGSMIHLPKLQLSGYRFQGWSDSASNKEKVNSLYTLPDQSTITLYGQWLNDPDTPVSIPTSGKGIDEAGSQSVSNVSGSSTTTYYMDQFGNKARSVALNSAPSAVIQTDLNILQVLESNSLQHPLALSLGENSGKTLTIAGNRTIENAPKIMASLPFSQSVDFISLPLSENSGSASTVAMKEVNGVLTPIANTLIKDNRLILEVTADQLLYIVDNVKTFGDVLAGLPQYGQNAIAFVSSRGLMKGVGNGERFDPFGTLSRAQLALILYRLAGEPSTEHFRLPEDVPANLWYSHAAAWSSAAGLMGQGSLFYGQRALSREEFAVILYRLEQGSQNNQDSQTPVNPALLDGYADGSQVSPWAREGMAWAIENQIIGQQSNLNPFGSSNRMNSAAMLQRFMENVYTGWIDQP